MYGFIMYIHSFYNNCGGEKKNFCEVHLEKIMSYLPPLIEFICDGNSANQTKTPENKVYD